MISAELKVVGGKHNGQAIPLDRKKFLIGREQDCHLRPNTELVSRHHCIFTVDDFSVRLRDLGSTNGTSINGETIRRETVLNQGDLVTVGSLQFQIVINEVASGTKTENIAAATDETIIAGSETLSEMTPIQPGEEPQITPIAIPENTAETETEQPTNSGASTEILPVSMPPQENPTGDTAVVSQMPGQPPYQPMPPQQPMMPQPMGYPMYGQQPYPGMPMQYPGQPYPGQQFAQPFPGQQMPMQQMPTQQMPAQQMPAQQMPAQPVAPQPAAEATAVEITETQPTVDVSLPDPTTTGAKEATPPPPAEKSEGGDEPQPAVEKSNQTADAIIKQYMQKRPGG